jgi:hypothetical protein
MQKFYDAYVKQLPTKSGYEGTLAWINRSSRVTPEYKTALAKPRDPRPVRICVLNKTTLILEDNEGGLIRMDRVE